MTAPEHDLSKLHINRDPPPQVRRAFGRTLVLVAVAVVLLAGAFLYMRGQSAPTVQTIVADPDLDRRRRFLRRHIRYR